MQPIVELCAVSKRYGEGDVAISALSEASLQVYAGELVVIEGPSGSGKTTLLSILGLILRPTLGEVRLGGHSVSGLAENRLPALRARHFGFVFQGFNLFDALSARENVALATKMKLPDSPDAHDEAAVLLRTVGLGDRMHHRPPDLSGGQKQRVAIARALAGGPAVVLADEPTAALDSNTALSIMRLLRDVAVDRGRSVVVVTHDVRMEKFADRVIRVSDGRIQT